MSQIEVNEPKNKPQPPVIRTSRPSHPEPRMNRCLNDKCTRTCDDPANRRERILGGRVVRYCCQRCLVVHSATGVVTKPVV